MLGSLCASFMNAASNALLTNYDTFLKMLTTQLRVQNPLERGHIAFRTDDIDAFADALRAIAADGPRWSYLVNEDTDEYEPDPDPRPLPSLPMRLVEHPHGHGESA